MNIASRIPFVVKRWLVFNLVGAMGIVVQMGTLFALTSGFHLRYLIATALAVEAAVLHNFIWHEHWTWADRIAGHSGSCLSRLLCFHLTNGVLSIAGNLILMRIFVEKFGFRYLPANAFAIGTCAILTFLTGDRIVFRSIGPFARKNRTDLPEKPHRIEVCIFSFAAAALFGGNTRALAAELHPDTLRAWTQCVQTTERRIGSELSNPKGFLVLDFQGPAESSRERQAVLSGEIPVRQMPNVAGENEKLIVPDGMIHHWRGSVFIPGVPLDFVFSRIRNPNEEDTRQEDVLDSRVLERGQGQLKLFLKLQRSRIVKVVYSTEHLVRYQWHGIDQASSSSIATKIAEIERLSGNEERERPEGHDHGYLWRLNSYWRYQQVPGGVIVECESLTLSRSIPSFLEYLVRPIISSIARESMHRTLESMRTRMVRSFRNGSGLSARTAGLNPSPT